MGGGNGKRAGCTYHSNSSFQRLISALTWAHNDKRLFIAAGAGVFVALVEKHLSSLQQLARNAIVESLHPSSEGDVLDSMGLSQHLNKFVSHALQPTITVSITINAIKQGRI